LALAAITIATTITIGRQEVWLGKYTHDAVVAPVGLWPEAIVFERYRDADAAIEHFANIGHSLEPIVATAIVTGEVLATPDAKMRAMALHDWESVEAGLSPPGSRRFATGANDTL
jgi:hypothetical protein